MKRALAGTKVRHYHGIDLSEPALELAAKNLAGMPFEVELDHRDFVEAMNDRPEPADASWCSLSIHHLQPDEKVRLLKAIRAATSKFLMIYEPTRLDGEDRRAISRASSGSTSRSGPRSPRTNGGRSSTTSSPAIFPKRRPAGSTSAARPASPRRSSSSTIPPTSTGSIASTCNAWPIPGGARARPAVVRRAALLHRRPEPRDDDTLGVPALASLRPDARVSRNAERPTPGTAGAAAGRRARR